MGLAAVVLSIALGGSVAWAQASDPTSRTNPSPAPQAARRWPQPVRVGDLHDRLVIEPSNHQTVLGRVDGIVRGPDGALSMVVRYGGVLGIFTRPVSVPLDAIALLGQLVEVVDLTRAQLAALPRYDPSPGATLPPDDTVRIGVTRN